MFQNSKRLRPWIFASAILVSGAVHAAYPTPGGVDLVSELYTVPFDSPQVWIEEYLEAPPEGEFSLAADPSSGRIIALGPRAFQLSFQKFMKEKTLAGTGSFEVSSHFEFEGFEKELSQEPRPLKGTVTFDPRTRKVLVIGSVETKDRVEHLLRVYEEKVSQRFVVQMRLERKQDGKRRLLGAPRLELAEGATGSLHLEGKYQEDFRNHWTENVFFQPEKDPSGKIGIRLRGKNAESGAEEAVRVLLTPGQDLILDGEDSSHPELKDFARKIQQNLENGDLEIRLNVQPM